MPQLLQIDIRDPERERGRLKIGFFAQEFVSREAIKMVINLRYHRRPGNLSFVKYVFLSTKKKDGFVLSLVLRFLMQDTTGADAKMIWLECFPCTKRFRANITVLRKNKLGILLSQLIIKYQQPSSRGGVFKDRNNEEEKRFNIYFKFCSLKSRSNSLQILQPESPIVVGWKNSLELSSFPAQATDLSGKSLVRLNHYIYFVWQTHHLPAPPLMSLHARGQWVNT